ELDEVSHQFEASGPPWESTATSDGLRGDRGLHRASATPARHRMPPGSAITGGTSPRMIQPSNTAIGGTRYVVEPRLPASVRASAYAQVEKPIAVGTNPRYTVHSSAAALE